MSLPFTRLMHSYWRVFTKIKVKRESTIQHYFAQMSIILKKKSGNFVKYANFTSTIDKGLQKDTCILNSNSHYYFFSYSFGIETAHTFIHSRCSLENHTRFQTKMGKFYQKPWSGTYLYGLYNIQGSTPRGPNNNYYNIIVIIYYL